MVFSNVTAYALASGGSTCTQTFVTIEGWDQQESSGILHSFMIDNWQSKTAPPEPELLQKDLPGID